MGSEAMAQTRLDGLYATFNTSKGSIVVSLDYKEAPLTVTNFIGLAMGRFDVTKNKPYYDGLVFHRVIPNFMIQGGDPQGNGTGGPGYQFPDESTSTKFDKPGKLAMANAGPATNGSQFFITHEPTPWLNGKHTIFGQVIEGQDIVDSIAQGDKITTLTITAVGQSATAFEAACTQATFDKMLNDLQQGARSKRRAEADAIKSQYPTADELENGILYEQITEGNKEEIAQGTSVSVHYTGRLLDGQVFDSSYERGEPIEFNVGTGMVIKGWDYMVSRMTVGEKGIVVIPPDLAYGEQGIGPIPPNSWLVFELEVVSIS